MDRKQYFTVLLAVSMLFNIILTFPYNSTKGESEIRENLQNDPLVSPWPSFRRDRNNTGVSPYSTESVNGTLDFEFLNGEYFYASAAIGDDGTVYVGDTGGTFFAINPNGSQKWNYSTGGVIASSAALTGNGRIIVGSNDDNLYCFREDGTVNWTFPAGGDFSSSPKIVDGTIYVGSNDFNLYALDLYGNERWNFTTNGSVGSSPAVDMDGNVYFGSFDNHLYSVDKNGGLNWAFETDNMIFSSPAVGIDGNIYFGSLDGKLYAVNDAGHELWNLTTGGEVWSSPAIGSDGTIYFGSLDAKLYAVNPDGTQKWNFTQNHLEDTYSSPVIDKDGRIYLSMNGCLCKHEGYLHAVDPSGDPLWNESIRWGKSSPAVAWDGSVYIGGMNFYKFGSDLNMFLDAGLNKTSALAGDSITVNGRADLNNGVYPHGANVTVELNGTDWYTEVIADGNFSTEITAPLEVGNFPVNITVDYREKDMVNSTQLHLNVSKIPRPDISISGLNYGFNGEYLHEGDQVFINCTVSNSGTAGAEFDTAMSIEEKNNVSGWKHLNLSAGTSESLTFTWTAVKGRHDIIVTADFNETCNDNKSDNSDSIEIGVIELKSIIDMGELTVVKPGIVYVGDPVEISTYVINTGNIDEDMDVALSVDAKDNYSSYRSLEVKENGNRTVTFNWTGVKGEHVLWVVLDPNNTVEGSVKTKMRNTTIVVLRKTAELGIEGMDILPKKNRTIGKELFIESTVSNNGNLTAEFDIVLFVDVKGNVSWWGTVELDPGESIDINIPMVPTAEQHLLWIILDYNDTVEENIETDNSIAGAISGVKPLEVGHGEGDEDDQDEDADQNDPEFPVLYLLPLIALPFAVLFLYIFFFKKRKDEEEEPEKDELRTDDEDIEL
ncbi:MAG: PQQ-binding-like beta-propeller repeat protein [Thermoplasmata archaeon]